MASEVPTSSGRLDARTRRSVVALLVSVFCSSAAIAALTITLGKQVFDLTGRELDLGLLGLAEFAPALLLVFVTGPVADRYDRRVVGAVALVLAAVCCLGLTAYAGTDPSAAGPIFVLIVAYGVARAFAMPATRSLPADTVVPARLPWLVARQSVTWQAAMIVGPIAAGFLYVVDVQLPYLVTAMLLLLSAASLAFVRTDARDAEVRARAPEDLPASGRVTLHDAFEGLRFVRGHSVLLGVISLDLFAVLFGGAVALLPAIAEERLHVGAVGLGWLRAAIGIGAAAVTLVLTVRPITRRVGTRLLLAVALFGVGTIVLGITTNYAVAWIALAVLSGADAVSVFIRATLVPLVTPADKRGRVLAVEMVFIGASNELGAFESGVVGQLLGPAAAIVLGGAATVAVAAIWASRFPALRSTDRFPSSIN
ncbi:MAG TPA: MFS transporter [Acidimicrobiia bacterium]|nr:MFS transporter [Acidimicrobiia bacterium]